MTEGQTVSWEESLLLALHQVPWVSGRAVGMVPLDLSLPFYTLTLWFGVSSSLRASWPLTLPFPRITQHWRLRGRRC